VAKCILNLVICCAVASILESCQNVTSTPEFLDGNFLTAGEGPIDLLSPVKNQLVTSSATKFSWTSKGVAAYVIEISADESFTQIIVSKSIKTNTYSLNSSDLINGAVLSTGSYFWRVKVGHLQNNLQSSVESFFLIAIPASGVGDAGAIYVDSASTASFQIGSKLAPYKKIQSAIEAMDTARNGARDIRFDIRVAGGGTRSYNESLTLRAGISVYGGYDPSADWSRNVTANPTPINSAISIGVFCGSEVSTAYTNTTRIDGFTINVNVTTPAFGFDLESCSPTISNNTIVVESTTNDAFGIYANGASTSQISSNNVTARNTTSNSVSVFGVWARNSAVVHLSTNTITAQGTQTSVSVYGIHLSNSTGSTVSRNTIQPSNSIGLLYGVSSLSSTVSISNNSIRCTGSGSVSPRGVTGSTASTLTVVDNLIFCTGTDGTRGVYLDASIGTVTGNVIRVSATGGSAVGYGIWLNSASSGTFSSNTISVRGTTTANAIRMNINNTAVVITRNILFTDSATNRFGVSEGATDDPSNFSENLIFDTVSLYYDEGSTALNNIATLCATLLSNGTSTCSGNLTTAGSLGAVFNAGYVLPASIASPSDLKTWAILPGGTADISGGSNGWSTGDIGADAANAGP